MRIWKPPVALRRDESRSACIGPPAGPQLDALLGALPLNGWMQTTVTPLEPHPNDPATPRPSIFQLRACGPGRWREQHARSIDPIRRRARASSEFPDPRLTPVYRLEATLGRQSTSRRGHGSAEVLARIGRGEDVDPSEYTFRTSTQIETAAAELDWLNKGVFLSVGGRQASGVVYETYLVQ